MSTALSGYGGTVKSGAVDMDVEGWSVDIEAQKIDTTTTADLGWEDVIGGTKSVKGSFDFNYNIAKKPTGAAQGIVPGDFPTITLQATTGEVFTGIALITKFSIKSKAREKVSVTATFESKGPWTLPS